eukprot:m51a1_g1226 hypothetical protein (448) ;mRNA; f:514345-516078
MSSSTAIPLSAQLVSTWKAQSRGGNMRSLKIQINNEECILAESFPKTATVEQDFGSLMAVVAPSEPCYVVFRLDDKGWLLVVFIPDKARVTDKLVYAATSPTLRRELGALVIDEVQFSNLAELTWSSYKAAKASVPCASEREQHIAVLDDMEATARREQEEDMRTRTGNKQSPRALPPKPSTAATPKAAVAPKQVQVQRPATGHRTPPPAQQVTGPIVSSTPAGTPVRAQGGNQSIDSLKSAFESGSAPSSAPSYARSRSPVAQEPVQEEGVKVAGIGGYHTVRLPWSDAAQDALRRLSRGAVNFVALKVDEEEIDLDKAESGASAAGLPRLINTTEPRFNFFSKPGATYFIYSCPEKSRPRTRMVYSTCKPTVAQEASSDPEEVSQQHLDEALRPARESDFGERRKTPPPVNTVSAPHPICAMITDNKSPRSGTAKAIVLPPSGAW